MKTEGANRSVRYVLLFWNISILAACLLGFCWLFREILSVRLLALVDTQLSARSTALIKLWSSIPSVAQDALRDELNSGQIGSRLFVPDQEGDSNARTTVKPDESLTGIFRPRAFTPDGKSYFNGVTDALLDRSAFDTALRTGEPVHATVFIGGNEVRVFSIPVQGDGGIVFVLQSARSLQEYRSEMRAVTTDLFRAIPFLLALSAVGGMLLTNRAMQPIRKLREATDLIEASDLSQRLPLVGSDEFTSLTDTLNRMLSRLEATFQQQAQFTADASHELRTPLTVMRGNTSLALVGERTAEEYKQTLERMHRSVTTMSVLVDELLLLSRADSRQILSTPENVQIREVVSAAIDQVNGNDDTRLSIHIPTADITVSGNLNLLARVFVNLLNNAMQHTEPSDTIELRIRISGTNVEIEIEDTGEGIKPEHVAHIMERFFRSDSSRSKYQGTGLGLAITRSIVQAHHGTIVVRSRYGIGTTVTVQLPLVARIA